MTSSPLKLGPQSSCLKPGSVADWLLNLTFLLVSVFFKVPFHYVSKSHVKILYKVEDKVVVGCLVMALFSPSGILRQRVSA